MTRLLPSLPRGTHASGHDASIVALLRAIAGRGSLSHADLAHDTRAQLVLGDLVTNAYVDLADGKPMPRGWATLNLVVSPAGVAVIRAADAAERRELDRHDAGKSWVIAI
jgi:hypothetical protein